MTPLYKTITAILCLLVIAAFGLVVYVGVTEDKSKQAVWQADTGSHGNHGPTYYPGLGFF